MKRWDRRPFEVRNLFNPAFCGLILFRALQGFEEEDDRGMPFSVSLLVLPLCLHKDSREIIARSSRTYFLKTVETHPPLVIGFAARARDLLPFALEGFGLLMERQCLSVTDGGRLRTVSGRVRKTLAGTGESVECQRVAKTIGRQFARVSDRATIYTALGVRP